MPFGKAGSYLINKKTKYEQLDAAEPSEQKKRKKKKLKPRKRKKKGGLFSMLGD